MTAELVVIAPDEARALTDRIKTGVEVIWDLIKQAYTQRAWDVLGYESWDDYCTREFGASRIRLPREERAEVVSSLRESGLSIRAIASATGDSIGTVQGALSGVQNRTPVTDDEDALAEELIAAEPVTGLDGKTYTPPPRPKPRWSDEEKELRRQLEAGQTVVVTLRGEHNNLINWAEQNGLYTRVDRRTDWGNPFITPDDGDRGTVIANYSDHYLPHKPSLQERLGSLRGKALGCWCAPEPCHADVLKKLADR